MKATRKTATKPRPKKAAAAPAHTDKAAEEAQLRAVWANPSGWRYWTSVNNTQVGLWYGSTAFAFMLFAGLLALLVRAQLAVPENDLLSAETLQPGLHAARHGDDVPLRRADLRGGGDLPAAADAGRARDAVPAPRGLRLLEFSDRRRLRLRLDLLRGRAEQRLVHVSATGDRPSRPASAPTSGCSVSLSSRWRRSPPRSS